MTVPRLTKEQAAIIGVFTGVTAGPFGDVHELIDTKFPGVTILGLVHIGQERLQEEFRDAFMSITYDPKQVAS